MASLTLQTIGLALFCALNFLEFQTWGASVQTLDLNNVNIDFAVRAASTQGKSANETKNLVKFIDGVKTLNGKSPRFRLQSRIDSPGTTITYKLGARVNGE